MRAVLCRRYGEPQTLRLTELGAVTGRRSGTGAGARRDDFTRLGRRHDRIVDTRTDRPPTAYLRALAAGGTYALGHFASAAHRGKVMIAVA